MDAVYANKTILELEGGDKENHIHYASLNFAKSQANSEVKSREGEIGGTASKETEYAQIRLHSRGSRENTDADANLRQKENTNGLTGQVSDKVRT